ncbi:MAG: DUF433 domain-containing protein [Chloroflexi bacterium]|nr:DUF433 domain-containing protein [Chloroflexota bacterium]MBU1662010.1 DUF433 domain-containing protein [Chloroflexota bacterium]
MKMNLIRERYGDDVYEYYPLGKHIVAAPGICSARPTFKYTRIEAAGALNLITAGYTLEEIATRFEVPLQAVEEALYLAGIHLESVKGAFTSWGRTVICAF